jgi:hypothetical protein
MHDSPVVAEEVNLLNAGNVVNPKALQGVLEALVICGDSHQISGPALYKVMPDEKPTGGQGK